MSGNRPNLRDHRGQLGPRRRADRRDNRDHEKDERQPHLEELRPLECLIDHGRDGERHPRGDEDANRDERDIATAHQERQDRHAARRPSRPHVGQDREETEQHAPRFPEADEACHGGLAGCQRVALDLHVEEVLHGHAEHRGPEKAEPDGRGHVGPEDVLPGAHAQSREDDARAEDLAERQRLGHVPVRHRRQVAVRQPDRRTRRTRSRVPREKEESC